jgi:hypothetical protein
MSRYTPEQIARIHAESARLLSDPPEPRPELAAPREVHVPESDPVAEWAADAEAFERQREKNRAELKRESRADVRHQRQTSDVLVELAARVSTLEDRVDTIAAALAGLDALASSSMSFSDAVTGKLQDLVALTNKVDMAVTTMRFVHEREANALRDRLAASEATHARETAMLTKQLADAQREIEARANIREAVVSRLEAAGAETHVENVVALVRQDLAERRR